MANGNNMDPFDSHNISKYPQSRLTNGTSDPKLTTGRQTAEKLGNEKTSNLTAANHRHPRFS